MRKQYSQTVKIEIDSCEDLGEHNEENSKPSFIGFQTASDTGSEVDSAYFEDEIGDLDALDMESEDFLAKMKFDFEKEEIPMEFVFKADKKDELDQAINKALSKIHVKVPFMRIKKSKYLIGSTSCMARITNNNVMLRVGGGWEKLEAFLLRHEEEHKEKLRRLMEAKRISLEQVIYDLLVKFEADESVLKAQKKKCVLKILGLKPSASSKKLRQPQRKASAFANKKKSS